MVPRRISLRRSRPKLLTHLPANAPQARAGDVRLQSTRSRERDRWSRVGQSAAKP